MGIPTSAIREGVLTLLTVQFVKGGGKILSRVAVVLIATDEHVFTWVDADDLLIVHVKTDMTCWLEGDLQRQRNRLHCLYLVQGFNFASIKTNKPVEAGSADCWRETHRRAVRGRSSP